MRIEQEWRLPAPAVEHLDDPEVCERVASERGHLRVPCEDCGGLGEAISSTSDPYIAERCDACAGTGIEHGECTCGEFRPMVPDEAVRDDGTTPGAIMMCERCAVSCRLSDAVSSVLDAESHEGFCGVCWAEHERRIVAEEREALRSLN